MIVGCYQLHLYCNNGPQGTNTVAHPYQRTGEPCEYSGTNEREAMRRARAGGWRFVGGEVYCSLCKGPKQSGVKS